MRGEVFLNMTLLDIVADHRATEEVFRARDRKAGTCLLCSHLFDTVAQIAEKYALDLEKLLKDLDQAARAGE